MEKTNILTLNLEYFFAIFSKPCDNGNAYCNLKITVHLLYTKLFSLKQIDIKCEHMKSFDIKMFKILKYIKL